MKTVNELDIYEIDGKEVLFAEKKEQKVRISNHWNLSRMVVIYTPDGKQLTVIASELIRAINNATNAHP